MSKIKNDGLDQYAAEPFEQQQFGTAGIEGVNFYCKIRTTDIHLLSAKLSTVNKVLVMILLWQQNVKNYHGSPVLEYDGADLLSKCLTLSQLITCTTQNPHKLSISVVLLLSTCSI